MRNRIAHNDSKRHHAAKGKQPLRNAYRNQSGAPKAMLDRALEAARPAELAVDDNQTDGPIHHRGQRNEQHRARQQARLPHCIWLADDAGADDGIGHVHKGGFEPGLGPPQLCRRGALFIVFARVIPFSSDRDAGRLDFGEQRYAVRVVYGSGAVVKVEPIVRRERRRRGPSVEGSVAEVEDARRQVELHAAGRSRRLGFDLKVGSWCLEHARDDGEVASLWLAGQQASVVIAEVGLAVVLFGHGHYNSVAASRPVTIFARGGPELARKRQKTRSKCNVRLCVSSPC